MASLTELEQWDEELYQLETTDPVVGGPNGISNQQAKILGNRTRYLKGSKVDRSDLQKGTHVTAVDTGVANAYVVALSPAVDALTNGMEISFTPANSNSGAATIAVSGLSAVPIVGLALSALQGGEIVASGSVKLKYNSTISSFVIISTTGALQISDATQSQHAVTKDQLDSKSSIGISGLKITYTGIDGVVTVSAKGAVVSNSDGYSKILRNILLYATSGSLTGAPNGLDTGSWAYSTWYFLYVIYNPTTKTAALLWSLSSSSPTLPSDYTYFTRIGANKTQSSTNYWFLGGTQIDRWFEYLVKASGNVTALPILAAGTQGVPATPTWVAISILNDAPVTADAVDIAIRAYTAATQVQCAPNSSYGFYGSSVNPPPLVLTTPAAAAIFCSQTKRMTLESTNIYFASNDSAQGKLLLLGWEDNI